MQVQVSSQKQAAAASPESSCDGDTFALHELVLVV